MAGLNTNRRHIQDSINVQPWHQLTPQNPLRDGKEHIVKYHFTKIQHTYQILVYDGITLRHQIVDGDREFQNQSKMFNPNIEASVSSLMEELCRCFEDSLKNSKLMLETEGSKLQISIKSKLKAGIPFNWTFSLEEAPKELLWQHIVQPVTIISNELFRRQQELFQMLERKDREIQDYKDQGTVVSRKHLETPYFDKTEYLNTSNSNGTFIEACTQPSLTSLSGNLSDIYRNVLLNIDGKQNSDIPAGPGPSATFDTLPITGRVAPSWSNEKRMGHSFIQDQVDGEQRQLEEKDDRVADVAMETKSPEEEEKNRREALRKRLDGEADKKAKKKKRKLNL